MWENNNALTQKIRNDFDQIALHEQEGWNHNSHYHNFLLKQLPFHCENVLDIGCGTALFSRLLTKGADVVVAIDLSTPISPIS
ncbi:class I SAM-dependent methyltransferase [Nostoc sp.]|uniref:class I SAM-dependent methyltransferase n=1 Tax=Nostoc sp. TaxID=1180 RepID=UPI002FFCCF97